MKRIIAFILILLLTVAALTGCGDRGKLLGTWQTQVDLADAMQEALGLEGLADEYVLQTFPVTATLTFQKDGTYTLCLDESSVQAAADTLLKDLETYLLDAMRTELTQLGINATLEQLFEATGIQLDTLLANMRQNFSDADLPAKLAEQVAITGQFKLSNGKLFLSDDLQAEPEDAYCSYTLEDGRLTLVEHSGSFLDEHLVLGIDVLPFQK